MSSKSKTTPAIHVVGLSKQYNPKKWAIRGLDFEVPRGVVFGFLGPNGAGKTTTIRTLMNFISPTRGIATILGMDSQEQAKQIHRQVGFVTGEMNYYENLTGRQYLLYMGNLQGKLDIKSINRFAKRLKAQLHVKIGTLSRGNKQKIGLIAAFQHQPELLIFDEPTTGLDPILQQEFRKIVYEHKQQGKTAFISSHFLAEVEMMCDMVAFINKGHVTETLPLEKLHERSLHEFDVLFDVTAKKSMLNGVAGVRELDITGNKMHVHISGKVDTFIKALAHYPVRSLSTRELDLEEVFMRLYGKQTHL